MMSKRSKKLMKMIEFITATVIFTSIDLICFFSDHYILAFITTCIACALAHGTVKSVISYLDEPRIVITKNISIDEEEKETIK